jgi:hypothetical protein
MFGGVTINESWRKRYEKGLLQLFGNFDILDCSTVYEEDVCGKWTGLLTKITINI